MNINKVVVTGRYPNSDHLFTTLLGNVRFDVNIKTGVVWESMRLNKQTGTHHNVIIENRQLKTCIIDAVNNFINNSN
jgi:hypothetical protein|tara:strand:+ start:1748 stop:1978 length:231 start_codon:yes stop_codon:yes gene_type:complete